MAGSSVNELLTNFVKTLCPSDKEIDEGKKRFYQIQKILHQSRVRNIKTTILRSCLTPGLGLPLSKIIWAKL